MLKLTKETDYGILILTSFFRWQDKPIISTRFIAQHTGIPYRMVCKVLNILMQHKLLVSHRGIHGGYGLTDEARNMTLKEVVEHLEGPIALMDCLSDDQSKCHAKNNCDLKGHWYTVNQAFRNSLSNVKLADMAQPLRPH